MAEITVKHIEDKRGWEEFLINHKEANFLQSWYWGEFNKNSGKEIFRLGFFINNKLNGVMLCVIESARRGRYMTVPGGPIIDWGNKKIINEAFSQMKKIAALNNCSFVRVRPQLKSNDFSKNIFQKFGFRNAPMHLHAELTTQLDINKSEDELLANMRKATRYEIKKAQKTGIKIIKTDDRNEIRKFYELEISTSRRQGFVPFTYKYLYDQFTAFANTGKALIYSAYHEDLLLAQAFIIFYGTEAAYHYGASTLDGRKYPGAYLIQWEAILDAKKRGLTRYNFWGVAPIDQKDHRFYGLSIFKRGFGGIDYEYLHAQDLVIDKKKYLINFVIENLRKRIRRV